MPAKTHVGRAWAHLRRRASRLPGQTPTAKTHVGRTSLGSDVAYSLALTRNSRNPADALRPDQLKMMAGVELPKCDGRSHQPLRNTPDLSAVLRGDGGRDGDATIW